MVYLSRSCSANPECKRLPTRAVPKLRSGVGGRPSGPARQQVRSDEGEAAAGEQVVLDPGSGGGGTIRFPVAYQKTRRQVSGPATQKIQDHPGCGLAPVARPAICRQRRLGVEGAVADIVKMGSRLCQFGGQLCMESPNILLRIKSSGDSRLVGDDEDEEPSIVQQFNRRLGAFRPAEPIPRADMAVIMVEYPVSVEKDGCTAPLRRHLMLRAGKRVGYPDIDEVSVEWHPQQPLAIREGWQHFCFERAAGRKIVGQRPAKEIVPRVHEPPFRALRALAEPGHSDAVEFDHPVTRIVRQRPEGDGTRCRKVAYSLAGKVQKIDVKP